jgi:hypothetical protein
VQYTNLRKCLSGDRDTGVVRRALVLSNIVVKDIASHGSEKALSNVGGNGCQRRFKILAYIDVSKSRRFGVLSQLASDLAPYHMTQVEIPTLEQKFDLGRPGLLYIYIYDPRDATQESKTAY